METIYRNRVCEYICYTVCTVLLGLGLGFRLKGHHPQEWNIKWIKQLKMKWKLGSYRGL